jgi:prepilin-type N-terminal cleavage/methylation domain-containing protein/prepilin-type processing-associated H-X9-DG protein
MAAPTRQHGFTLLELLVVLAIICLLVAIVILAAGLVRQSSVSTVDATRQRQLVFANINYTTDYQGRWLNPMTNADADCWVKSYGNNMGPGNSERPDALYEGAAWDYVGDLKAYKSPEDDSDRVRSYSYNAQVGVRPDGYHVSGGFGPNTISVPMISMPSKTMMTVPEFSEYGHNPQGFYVGIPGTSWEGCWVDFPAYWNPKGVNIGYVDGSVGFYAFQDPNLPQLVDHASTWGVEGPDLDFFAEIMYPGWDGSW